VACWWCCDGINGGLSELGGHSCRMQYWCMVVIAAWRAVSDDIGVISTHLAASAAAAASEREEQHESRKLHIYRPVSRSAFNPAAVPHRHWPVNDQWMTSCVCVCVCVCVCGQLSLIQQHLSWRSNARKMSTYIRTSSCCAGEGPQPRSNLTVLQVARS